MHSGATPGLPASLECLQVELLETLCGQERPLTLKQISRLTQLPETELQQAVDVLRSLCLVTRLNTIIDSYTVTSSSGIRQTMRVTPRTRQISAAACTVGE
ncbi:MAG: hypothetical protein JW990_03705 [Thermoleophilia bacterium]|nr:hypothetical protein [Thermoleophilia bacterium]